MSTAELELPYLLVSQVKFRDETFGRESNVTFVKCLSMQISLIYSSC